MRLYSGTSGFSYQEWHGAFYPEDLPAADRLAYYAARLPAVEINQTFYRMPRASLLTSWAAQVPDAFRFAVKTGYHPLREIDVDAFGFKVRAAR